MIRVLVLNSDNDGVGYYRILNPHMCMNYPDIRIDIRLLSDGTLPLLDEKFLRHYNIIFYNKVIPFSDKKKEDYFYFLCKKHDIKIVWDIDDYWILDNTHLNYKNWKANKSQERVEEVMKMADVVTTTTPIFADEIRKINENVEILPNALNLNEQQWISNKEKSDKVRFIWGGGISHMVDLRLLKEEFKLFDREFLNNAQLYLCGYDLRIKMQDGRVAKDNPRRSQWGFFESIFTNNNKYIKNGDYVRYLDNSSNFDQDGLYGKKEEFKNEFYQRRHTKSIFTYGEMYNEADVGLAPLKNKHTFNLMKSQLKLIESGAHKMPLIMSKYGPYTLDDLDGAIDKKQKGIYIEEEKGGWYKAMKWYLNNKNAIIEHGEALHEYVKENYSMPVINEKRANLYREIAQKHRTM